MPPPSQLSIATSSLKRLVKEEASYHKELKQQEERIKKLEAADGAGAEEDAGNREFQLKQEKRAVEETKAVFPDLRSRIQTAKENLQGLLDAGGDDGEVSKAKEALAEIESS